MTLNNFHVSSSEKRNRKIWLAMTLLPYALHLIFFFYIFFTGLLTGKSCASILMLIPAIIVMCIPCWIIWHCAYKKHGTRLLTTQLVLTFISTFLNICLCFGNLLLGGSVENYVKATSMTLTWWGIAWGTVAWVLGFQLRKTNKKLYFHKHCTEEYLGAIEKMRFVSSEEERQELYHSLLHQWPRLKYYTNFFLKQK